MTNGEKIKEIFPSTDSRLDEKTGIMLVKWVDGTTKCFKADWWDAEYQEPKQNIFDHLTAVGQGMIEGEKIADAKWKQAIKDIKAEIEAKNTSIEGFADTHGWVNGLTNEHNAHEADLTIIDKHTKELMK